MEQVCRKFNDVITDENRKSNLIWKPLLEKKVKNDSNWKEMAKRRGWIPELTDGLWKNISSSQERYSTNQIEFIEANDEYIFVITNKGKIKVMNKKDPHQWITLTGHNDFIDSFNFQGRFL